MDDIVKSGYYESSLGFNIIDCFVDEVTKVEKRKAFYFKNNNKDIIKIQDKEDFNVFILCRFYEKQLFVDKIRDHFHLTSEYKGPAHYKCHIKVTQKQSIFVPFVFQNFGNKDCQLF